MGIIFFTVLFRNYYPMLMAFPMVRLLWLHGYWWSDITLDSLAYAHSLHNAVGGSKRGEARLAADCSMRS
jgi:hypothetical protein